MSNLTFSDNNLLNLSSLISNKRPFPTQEGLTEQRSCLAGLAQHAAGDISFDSQ